jgi:D-amino-acid dehydrogenase
MTRLNFDTVVLGAGMVGVCVAVHLQKRGRQVALVDRKLPGNETSFGNAGLIQREGVYPYALPRDLGTLLRYARNRSPEVRYHANAMLKAAPFLWQYWRNSHPAKHAVHQRAPHAGRGCRRERAVAANRLDQGVSHRRGTRRGNPAR